MVIFHSYVKLPEGKPHTKEKETHLGFIHVTICLVQPCNSTSNCWSPASCREISIPEMGWCCDVRCLYPTSTHFCSWTNDGFNKTAVAKCWKHVRMVISRCLMVLSETVKPELLWYQSFHGWNTQSKPPCLYYPIILLSKYSYYGFLWSPINPVVFCVPSCKHRNRCGKAVMNGDHFANKGRIWAVFPVKIPICSHNIPMILPNIDGFSMSIIFPWYMSIVTGHNP